MEILGLILVVPAVVVANVGYVLLVRFGFSRATWLRSWLLWPSRVVLVLAALDVALVATLGAVAAGTRIGPAFWPIHELVVLAGAPSLANVLVLSSRGVWFRRWWMAIPLCCVAGVFLVFFQVGVGDALFGPDGVAGPFSPD